MDLLKIFTIAVLVGYSLLAATAGLNQWRQKRIQGWSATGMLLTGLLMLFAAWLLWAESTNPLWALLVALVLLHALTINNGLHMYGKINWSHHVGRLLISLILLVLTYLSMS